MMYEYGRGLLPDPVTAYMWYLLGDAQGDPIATDRLARLARTLSASQIDAAESRARARSEAPPQLSLR